MWLMWLNSSCLVRFRHKDYLVRLGQVSWFLVKISMLVNDHTVCICGGHGYLVSEQGTV